VQAGDEIDSNISSMYDSPMSKYPFEQIEKKWQNYCEEQDLQGYGRSFSSPEKRKYVLDMFNRNLSGAGFM
jgi:hypothetical protein